MQREIKFRAWDKKMKEMVNDEYWLLASNGKLYEYSMGKLSDETDKYEIMQYTGLEDKNGKDIYEGDIVKSDWYNDTQRIVGAPVIFSSGRFTCLRAKYDLYLFPDLEVIGNIYEHSHLLDSE